LEGAAVVWAGCHRLLGQGVSPVFERAKRLRRRVLRLRAGVVEPPARLGDLNIEQADQLSVALRCRRVEPGSPPRELELHPAELPAPIARRHNEAFAVALRQAGSSGLV